MWLTYVLLSILLMNTVISPTQSVDITNALSVFKIGKEIVSTLIKTWNILDIADNFNSSELPWPLVHKTERKLFNKLEEVQLKLETLNSEIDAVGRNTLSSFMDYLPKVIKLELRLNTLLQQITEINGFYENLKQYTNNSDYGEETLMNFARSVTSHSEGSVKSLLESIHLFVVPAADAIGTTDTGILTPMTNALKDTEGGMFCDAGQSPQQVLYNLFNAIELAELKGYIMMQFSYMLLKLYKKDNFTNEAQLVLYQYEQRTTSTIKAVKAVLEPASRELWKCDPKKYIENETYIEVTQLLQGYIESEVDLNPEGTCSETCGYYAYGKSHGCYQNLYCKKQRKCNGKIINCQFIDSHMLVCPADPLSGKRYDYVEYENGRILGNKHECSNRTIAVNSWWRWLFWHCSYCFCLCDEQGVYSDRYINMRSRIADIKNNMVITGLRFAKKNRIIHIQIQEGRLLPMGNIDPKTVKWVPVEDYNITDRNIYNGQDYHTLSWEQRSMDLDDLVTDEKHVITGIRFKKIGYHVNFEIYQTPFDFQTGNLLESRERSTWKDNSNTEATLKNPRTQLRLNNPDVSIRTSSPSRPDSKSDQYVEFTNTGLDRDAAQTTVPFFDSQPVESLIPVPLSGAGIYHKGQKNFGGFIGVKIFTYDFSKHLYAPDPVTNRPVSIQ